MSYKKKKSNRSVVVISPTYFSSVGTRLAETLRSHGEKGQAKVQSHILKLSDSQRDHLEMATAISWSCCDLEPAPKRNDTPGAFPHIS